MNKVIKTDKLVNFCGGCNNSITSVKFVAVDECESLEKAMERRQMDDA